LPAESNASKRSIVQRQDCGGRERRPFRESATKRPKIVAAAFVESCWLTIEPASAER